MPRRHWMVALPGGPFPASTAQAMRAAEQVVKLDSARTARGPTVAIRLCGRTAAVGGERRRATG